MKKGALILCIMILFVGVAGNASATSYAFEDPIDFTAIYGMPGLLIENGIPFTYFHDVSQEVDFGAGDVINEATLAVVFFDADGDIVSFTMDTNELVVLGLNPANGSFLTFNDLGEVDSELYPVAVELDWFTSGGILDVGIAVYNLGGNVYLTSSTVSGLASAPPVPEPGTVLMFGAGLAGFAWFRRRKSLVE